MNDPIKYRTLGQLLDTAVQKSPSSSAVIYWNQKKRLSWRELSRSVDLLAKGLIGFGVKKGERIALWAPNSLHWVELMFAAAKVGAVLLPLNTKYGREELNFVLDHSGAEFLFLKHFGHDQSSVKILAACEPRQKESLRHICVMDKKRLAGAANLDELLLAGHKVSDEQYLERQSMVSPSDVVNMQYTSGTTGSPKGVMLSHVNIGTNGFWVGENQSFTSSDRICLPVPLYHCFGCVMGVIGAVSHGSTMVILERPDPVQIAAAVEIEKCTALYGVPTIFQSILNHQDFSGFDLGTLRTGIMAGASCPAPVVREVIKRMHIKELTICYGLTEASPVITQTVASDPLTQRTSSVGRPLPGIEVRIEDLHTEEPLPAGEEGEICCRGYSVMQGYFRLPRETSEVIDEDGWLHSGDCGYLDGRGYLHVTNRTKDIIIRGGENISPREIEDFLHRIPSIADAHVVGIKSVKYGEEVCAFIKLKRDARFTASQIRDLCQGNIARFKIPRHIFFVDDFPMTGSGKVQKFKLREMAERLLCESKALRQQPRSRSPISISTRV